MRPLAHSSAKRKESVSKSAFAVAPACAPCSRAAKSRSSIAASSIRAWRRSPAALAVVAVRGPKILAVDDLGEADDRVQRRLISWIVSRRRRAAGQGRTAAGLLDASPFRRATRVAEEAAVDGRKGGCRSAHSPSSADAGAIGVSSNGSRSVKAAPARGALLAGQAAADQRRRAGLLDPADLRPTRRIPTGNQVRAWRAEVAATPPASAVRAARLRRSRLLFSRSIRATISPIEGTGSSAGGAPADPRAAACDCGGEFRRHRRAAMDESRDLTRWPPRTIAQPSSSSGRRPATARTPRAAVSGENGDQPRLRQGPAMARAVAAAASSIGPTDSRMRPWSARHRAGRIEFVVRAGQQVDELAPADGPVVGIRDRLGHHRPEAVIETHLFHSPAGSAALRCTRAHEWGGR